MWPDVRRDIVLLICVLVVCARCGSAVEPPATTPAPTLAGLSLRPSPAPSTTRVGTASPPAASPSAAALATPTPLAAPSAQAAPTPVAAPFVYLWPSYLPSGMQLSPKESRVAREGEVGEGGLGFFIITFQAGTNKLVVGGGATETLPLSGDRRHVTAGSREGTLITNGDQRQIVFDVPKGSLFVYSFGLGQEELLRVAGSLEPIDVQELRRRAAPGS